MKQERRFMKKIFYATMLMTVCGLCARADEATLNRNASLGNSMNDYVGKFGVGVLIGEPMAASVKYWMNDSLALDGAAGWSFRRDTDFYLHADVLWHQFDLIPVSRGRLPVYFGVGAMGRFRDNNRDNERSEE